MDKKKVKELIFEAHHCIEEVFDRQADNNNAIDATSLAIASIILLTAISELSKSDWVSVEEELPPYEEDVLVCNENEPSDMWFGHRTSDRRVVVDEHEFAKGYGTITHWHKIDKLED